MMIRPIDPRTEAIVAHALDERFTIKACEICDGPEICSKVHPRAKCFGCGTVDELGQVAPAERRWRCDRCRKYYRAVYGLAKCPKCRESGKRQEAREKSRDRRKQAS